MTLNEVVTQLSNETGLTEIEVIRIYKAFWLSIRHRIAEKDLKNNPESISFNIPELGKLYCNKEIILKIKEHGKLQRKTD